MGDGYGISGQATVADLQLYAWSNQTLPYNTSGTLKLSSTQNGNEKILDYKPAGNENQVFTRAWIQSSISPSSGYRFPGTGALSYETTAYDKPCTYGGMVYAYTTQAARFWQPGNANGAMVCIASCLGTAINNQALNEGTAVLHSWELDVNECRTNPCKNGATCENYFHSYACRCAPGYAGKHCENDTD
ncbi:hypothetical protein DPMN_056417 [Dreissena polymorpha]|uniref:EGF-like domain-containing protein n=1 Tax=Dreissena polymorpha TaxID=45954 RepID=A0A9D4CUG2_DREPO|nr:hypothetical protein DPMN_056417 [Dreissena polymorpha]